MKRIVWCVVCCLLASLSSWGQNLRQIAHPEGLTNSTVLDVCPDSEGIVWVGTCEGLYSFFANQVRPVRFPGDGDLDGQLVEQIVFTGDDLMWVRTGIGLRQFSKQRGSMIDFPVFQGGYRIAAGSSGAMLVRDMNGQMYRWDEESGQFSLLRLPLAPHSLQNGFGSSDSYLWLAGKDGVYRFPWLKDENGVRPGSPECILPDSVIQCVHDSGQVYVVSSEGMLYHLDIDPGRSSPIMDIHDEIRHRGHLTGVVEMQGNLFLSFIASGVLKYHREEGYWKGEDIGLKVGVFRISRDRLQDILWIASDGQGLFQYWDSEYSVRQFFSTDFHSVIGQPVRSLFKDPYGALWIGTKGSGLLRVDSAGESLLFTAENSALRDNAVYALSESGLGGFWVGSEEGLNFFDFRSERLLPVEHAEEIRYVHAVREVGDSLLQLATVGTGVVEASISRRGDRVFLGNIRRYTVEGGAFSSNYFFSMHADQDGTLWLGNRGLGLFSLENGVLTSRPVAVADSIPAVSNVFAVAEAGGRLWAGTGNGLVALAPDGTETYIDRTSGLPNNTVHALLPDADGGVWISTNDGLARYSPVGGIVRYGRQAGLSVIEFSDGAATRSGGTLYFGGVNGWVEVTRNEHYKPTTAYVPRILFSYLRAGNRVVNLFSSLRMSDNTVIIPPGENAFSIDFWLNDWIHDSDYTMSYCMGGSSWIPLGPENRVAFSGLSSGKYRFQVRARNRMTGAEVMSEMICIRVKAPWYMTTFMKVVYVLLALLAAAAGVLFLIYRARRREKDAMDALERRHKEELYEEKLMFFTNITHEFKTPLALIYTPCEQILSYRGTDSYVRKYTRQIRDNAERLGALIQEVIDYRRLETKHQEVRLHTVDLSGLCREAADGFVELAGNNGIFLEEDIEDGISWNTDRKCFLRIESNLITNALKYTKVGGTVRVTLKREPDSGVLLKVFNTGKGIPQEARSAIFDRYKVLDGIEETHVSSITGRNGLGLSICKSTVELLGGTISVDSKVGEWAEFTVSLPPLPLPAESGGESVRQDIRDDIRPKALQELRPVAGRKGRPERKGLPVLLAVDDNPAFLALLEDALDTFDVRTATDGATALEILKEERPVLVITDVMMPGTDGYEFTREIRQNKHTMHIPVIILSARNEVEDRVKGMNLGADAYLGKPFSLAELKALITQLLGKGDLLKEYYNTSASAFDYVDGKLISTEDREFLADVDAFLEKELSSGEITVERMAESLHLSSRNLYRRFKALDMLPPNEFIRDRKLTVAARLLCTTGKTIQEIIYECGFNNRAHFYKEFGKRFGCTPKEYRDTHRTMEDDFS